MLAAGLLTRQPRIPRRGIARHLILTFSALVFALGLAEGMLRLWHPSLPSLQALHGTDFSMETFPVTAIHNQLGAYATQRCRLFSALHDQRIPFVPNVEPENTFRLALAGDSVAAGKGVLENQALSNRLAQDLSTHLGQPARTRNFSASGAGVCAVVARAHQALLEQDPDLLLVVFFADDLEDRVRLALAGQVLAFPDQVQQPLLRQFVSHSWLANLVWFTWTTRSTEQPDRLIDAAGERLFKDLAISLVRHSAQQGVPLVVVLLAPAGLPFCKPDPPPTGACAWMPADLDRMARWLTEAQVPFLDLRHIWDDRPNHVLRIERRAFGDGGMGIHPDADGHAILADAILPTLLARLGLPADAQPQSPDID